MFDLFLDLVCRFSPLVGASALLALAFISIALWRGGTIEALKIPGLFDVKLGRPINFSGKRYLSYVSILAFVAALFLAGFQLTQDCSRCEGMPGQTAWIYAGSYDSDADTAQAPPFVESDPTGVATQNIAPNTWIKLLERRNTMILDYATQGTERALDSPFRRDGKVSYTCKWLEAGDRVYVAAKEINGPSPKEQHIWFRVRFTRPGG